MQRLPSAAAYAHRFGSLVRAYQAVGFTPDRDYQYLEVNQFLRRLHPEIVGQTEQMITDVGGVVNVRMFLHPCYDTIPDAAFVDVRVRMKEDALIVTYRVVRPVGIELHVFQQLKSHFEKLDLADRYRRMGIEHLGGQYPALHRAFGPGKDGIRVAEKLIEGAEDFEDVAGPNYWLAKLYRALASNKEFCEGGFEAIRVQRQSA